MPLIPSARSLLGPLALFGTGGLVCLAPLALGGAPPLAHAVLTGLALAIFCVHAADRHRQGRPITIPWTIAPLVFAFGATLMVLLPLPAALRALLDARGADLKEWVAGALPAAAQQLVLPVLAVDPPEAALAMLRVVAAACVFVVIADRARRRQPREKLHRLFLVGGVLVLAIALFHRLANLHAIYGVVPVRVGGPLYGPLVNPNHLARVLGAFSFLALSGYPALRNAGERVATGFVAGALALGVFLTYSRGGALAFVATAVLGTLLWWFSRWRGESADGPDRAAAAVPLVTLTITALAVWFVRDALVKEFESIASSPLESSKAYLYGPALDLVRAHPWVGVGPGGFRTALPSLVPIGELPTPRFTHVENVLLEILSSHGLVLGSGLLATAGATAWHLLRRLRSPATRGPVLVLVFLFVGDMFDFVLQIPAGLLLAAAALGLAAATAVSAGAPALRWKPIKTVPVMVLLMLVTAASTWMALPDSRRALDTKLEHAEGEARRELLTRAMARHPLDPWYAYALAVEARNARDVREALVWANRALILDPNSGSAHQEAARALWAIGNVDQALSAYRLAWAATRSPDQRLIEELARRTPDLQTRLKAVPSDDRRAVESVCRQVLHEQRYEVALRCWNLAREAFEDDEDFRVRAAAAAVAAGQADTALQLLAPLLQSERLDGVTLLVLGRATERKDGLVAAYGVVAARRGAIKTRTYPLDRWIAQAALRLGRYPDAQQALVRARARANRAQRLELDEVEARMFEQMGNKAEALVRWQKIANSQRAPSARLQQARLEMDLNLWSHAQATLREAKRRTPELSGLESLEARLAAHEKETVSAP